MKSKRAKEYIQDKDNQLWGVSMGVPLYIAFDVEKAVTLAEQDAEQRCVKIIEYVLLEKLGSTMARNILLEIKNNLNNGGQSDEYNI